MNETVEERIASRIDQNAAREIAVSAPMGGLTFDNASQIMDFAKILAISGIAIPKHLRGNPGACLAVTVQAIEWRLSPYAVANKSYSVNDRLAYESQLIQAVILQRAPIKGRLKVEFKGTGDARVCRVWAELKDGEIVEYESPPFGRITPKNSPLWKTDPDQQQFYYAGRSLCRRHFPDVLLGIYARDEIEDDEIGPDRARDVTPRESGRSSLDRFAAEGEPAPKRRGRPPKAARESIDEHQEPAPPTETSDAGQDTATAAAASQSVASDFQQEAEAEADAEDRSTKAFAAELIKEFDACRSISEANEIAAKHRPAIRTRPNAEDRMDLAAIVEAYRAFAGQNMSEAELEREIGMRLEMIGGR